MVILQCMLPLFMINGHGAAAHVNVITTGSFSASVTSAVYTTVLRGESASMVAEAENKKRQCLVMTRDRESRKKQYS